MIVFILFLNGSRKHKTLAICDTFTRRGTCVIEAFQQLLGTGAKSAASGETLVKDLKGSPLRALRYD